MSTSPVLVKINCGLEIITRLEQVASLSRTCPDTYSKLFLEVDAVLLLLNLTFFVLPIFSAPVKYGLNRSNDTFLEADIARNYRVDSSSSCS